MGRRYLGKENAVETNRIYGQAKVGDRRDGPVLLCTTRQARYEEHPTKRKKKELRGVNPQAPNDTAHVKIAIGRKGLRREDRLISSPLPPQQPLRSGSYQYVPRRALGLLRSPAGRP